MSTHADHILMHLRGASRPLDDDELAALLGVRRQAINIRCRDLAAQGLLKRVTGVNGKLVNVLVGGGRPSGLTDAPPPRQSSAAPLTPGASDAWDEATTQAMLVRHLAGDGWLIEQVANTATRQHGVDVLATKDGVGWAIEVKGWPGTRYADPRRQTETKPTNPTVQARHWFATALLSALFNRDALPDRTCAMAFPDPPTYRSLAERTQSSLRTLGVVVLFVTEDGLDVA